MSNEKPERECLTCGWVGMEDETWADPYGGSCPRCLNGIRIIHYRQTETEESAP